jgi:DNA invertase Pin-like site-specific DNA recombinase
MGKRKRTEAGDPRRAVASLRVSTDQQAPGLHAQRRDIERWAAAREVTVVAWHEDRDVSGGAALDDRPGLLAALDDLARHRAGVLVVAKRDRLARDVLHAGAIEAAVVARGARVVSADGAADGDDPAARMVRQLLDVFAEFERGMIRARTRAALAARRTRGLRVSGHLPFGRALGADGRSLVPCPGEAATVRLAYELRRERLTLRAVAVRLAYAGHMARSGRPFGPQAVANMLQAGS